LQGRFAREQPRRLFEYGLPALNSLHVGNEQREPEITTDRLYNRSFVPDIGAMQVENQASII
jgi:hypothetical protein